MSGKGEVWVVRESSSDKEKGLGQGDLKSGKGKNDKTLKSKEIEHARGWKVELTQKEGEGSMKRCVDEGDRDDWFWRRETGRFDATKQRRETKMEGFREGNQHKDLTNQNKEGSRRGRGREKILTLQIEEEERNEGYSKKQIDTKGVMREIEGFREGKMKGEGRIIASEKGGVWKGEKGSSEHSDEGERMDMNSSIKIWEEWKVLEIRVIL